MTGRIAAMLTGALVACGAALAMVATAHAAPVKTIDGIVIITQADALAGGVTVGDAPGYPITISAAGSYRFGGPLTVTPSGLSFGIEITAPLVTIDFNGFALDGSGDPGLSAVSGTQRGLTIRNGTIRNFGQTGISLLSLEAVVSSMRIANVGGTGIGTSNGLDLGKGRHIFRDNVINGGNTGISCRHAGCLAIRNVVSDPATSGIFVVDGGGAAILDNVISSADQGGVFLNSNAVGVGRNLLSNNTIGGNPAPFGGPGVPGSLGPNVCSPLPNPVPAGC